MGNVFYKLKYYVFYVYRIKSFFFFLMKILISEKEKLYPDQCQVWRHIFGRKSSRILKKQREDETS